ncbi:MAG: hypothetical protein JO000_29585 [Alphaproteobacteria bacterium]|nr:hypothetical protein [Alphaproteobacteria bacterium]
MRHVLILALFVTSAASAAADPLTERNNDATLRPPAARALPHLPPHPVPMRQDR